MVKKIILNFFLIAFIITMTRYSGYIEINGVLPDFILILVLFNGIFNDPIYAMIFGFFAGLSMDVTEFYPLLGFNALLYTVVGYITSITKIFSIDNALISTVFMFLFILIKALIFTVIGFFCMNPDYILNYFSRIFLIEIPYTIIISIPIFLIFKRVDRINKKAKVYE